MGSNVLVLCAAYSSHQLYNASILRWDRDSMAEASLLNPALVIIERVRP